MSIEAQIRESKKNKFSTLSILSFSMSLVSLTIMFISFMNTVFSLINNETIKLVLGIILIIAMLSSFVLAIIDVSMKDRKKTLSIISLVIGGGFLFIIILFILTLYTASGP